MLEFGNTLRTWALAEAPLADLAIAAEQLPDHRLAYLDYEGPVSGDRGSVSRWDAGRFTTTSESPTVLTVKLTGDRLNGTATLLGASDNACAWRFTFEPQTATRTKPTGL